MKDRAIFLDRDGTLVHPRHYPSRPEELVLYHGIAPGLRRLQTAGFRLIVVTNQSGIARGYFSMADLQRMHHSLARELSRLGVRIDQFYSCPHHPDGTIPELAVPCTCRKPQPGMILQAASEYTLDLSRSWFIGDILDDIEAGSRSGCRTILIDLGTEGTPPRAVRRPDFVARDTRHALRIISTVERLGPPCELSYRPDRWTSWAPLPNREQNDRLRAMQGGTHGDSH